VTKVVHYSGRDVPISRKAVLQNMGVSRTMIAAAQAAVEQPYPHNMEYGINDSDMAKAIKAALLQAAREAKT
jgi:hypothetical protein